MRSSSNRQFVQRQVAPNRRSNLMATARHHGGLAWHRRNAAHSALHSRTCPLRAFMQLSTAVYSAAQPFAVLLVATRAANDVGGTAETSAHFTHDPSMDGQLFKT
jgi:hypothetical protein